MTSTAFRTCPLCEATCGVAITIDDGRVVQVRGDADDVFSHGYICPKGVALGELHEDPARLRHPLVRDENGELRRASWDEAWAEIARLLGALREQHGPEAVGVYLGNPNVHNVSSTLYSPALIRALGTPNVFTASTVDQMPAQVAAALVFGTGLSVPIADIDRTSYLLVLGANPVVSNGSMMTAPDFPGRLRALRARGGRLVVVDPIRTRTADLADEHLPIRPGTDAFLLAAMARVILDEDLVDLGAAAEHLSDDALESLTAATRPFSVDVAAEVTGLPGETIARLARELAAAPTAAVYGRMGTTTAGMRLADGSIQSFGTAASWWITVVSLLTGNLDRPGGVMWPLPAAGSPNTSGTPGVGRGLRVGPHRSRVRGLAAVMGELPVATLAEEIDTPDGDGSRLRGLFVIAGNPVVSTPDGGRLAAALTSLDLLICVDAYLTETSRMAHVVLPAASPLARPHFDVAFAALAVRNVARWAPAALPLQSDGDADEVDEGEVLLRLACIALGDAVMVDAMDDIVAFEIAKRASASAASRAHGVDPAQMVAAVAPRRREERLIDLMIRSGPYGDGFGRHPDGLTLASLEAAPHGIDLGPLQPRLPEMLRTPSGRIEIDAPPLLAEAGRMADALDALADPASGLVLVGRRSLRGNNSWMHNVPTLAGGSNRCTLLIHPDDARRLGVMDRQEADVRSTAGSVRAVVEVTADICPGVVSLPHGWGHDDPQTWGPTATANPGVNSNLLTPSSGLDHLSGNAVLNGIPVTVTAA